MVDGYGLHSPDHTTDLRLEISPKYRWLSACYSYGSVSDSGASEMIIMLCDCRWLTVQSVYLWYTVNGNQLCT